MQVLRRGLKGLPLNLGCRSVTCTLRVGGMGGKKETTSCVIFALSPLRAHKDTHRGHTRTEYGHQYRRTANTRVRQTREKSRSHTL